MRDHFAFPADYLQQIQRWQKERAEHLLAPSGWLSLVGFDWLKQGANRVGSAADNDIVFDGGPAYLGIVTLLQNGEVHIRLNAESEAAIDGKPLREATLLDDTQTGGGPSTVSFGAAQFYVINREGRKGLRVKDDEAVTRKHFGGLDYFFIDSSWRVIADWIPFATPAKLRMTKRLGTTGVVDVPGKAVFQRHGRSYELLPYQERPDGDLFFVLADQTSGNETYDGARFLYAALPKNGQIVLDFNKAHNPPSAFTPYANCPLAPPENQLEIRVTAGEKRYRGHQAPSPSDAGIESV
ncbi:DUF1684 domain-containing protein [Dyella tabacisoli]|uniref:DUF1684 domain-containing protein n=1 Tax=Dyella tabacisoli TaxID=2282381 RepID=A0A369UQP6_9GAMM|nr:DUF1684 domain-containing protein [Dyella tabacisoli]RDD83082.1 DUF1684 domain-containing protein [Dyella tabacisoli]